MFVKTIHEIKRRGVDVLGLMIGDVITDADREYRKSIDSYIRDNELKGNIYAPGFRKDIADILAASDCVVVPSSEGMPLTVLEAMCAKRRVVGMDAGGSNEVIKDAQCGEVYPADGTEKEIADAIFRAMEKQTEDILERGYEFCCKHDIDNYKKLLTAVFLNTEI